MHEMASLETQLAIPSCAFLPPTASAKLSTTTGTSIHLSPAASIHSSTTFLLVGRQASTADIRIDHKSISRKHAVLYFMKDGEKHDVLVLKDLGGKYGCQVNGTKVVGDIVHITNGDRIQFGNVRESIFTLEMDSDLVDHESNSEADNEASNQSEEYMEDQGQGQSQSQGNNADEPVLNGRAAREAEIAKMMASLDETPSFTKYESNDKEKEMSQPVHESKPLPSIATQLKLPITSNITLPAQSNSLPTSIIFDPAGSRLLVGSSDTTLRLYDFNGMDLAARPFKVVTVQDGHSIVKVVTSNTGDRVFVGTTSAQPIVLDRDGHQILEFNKGDMYVTDMAHTDGHVANVTGVDWHPLNRDIAITCSFDGSVRMWNLEKNKTKFHKLCSGKEVYRIKSSMGKRTKVMCVTFAPGGREFACGTSCGSIQIWNSTKVGSRPERVIYDAHGGNAVHSLVYNYDGSKLASRSMDDDCVKVWEARRISRSCQPLAVCEGLHGLYESVNCAFSPDGLTLCAGTCIEPKNQADTYCVLKFFRIDSKNKNSLPILELDVAKGVSIANIAWHNKLNQIAMGLSDGSLRVFYDAKWSTKGAKLPVSKGLRKTDDLTLLLNSRAPQGSAGVLGEIRTPHALPIFQTTVEKSTKRKREKDRQDPIKSRRPDLPGTGIKVSEGTSAGLNFQQTVLTSAIAKNKNIAGKDPRDELFKYNEGKEYTKTLFEGDKRILAEKTVEEEEEEAKKQNK